MPTARRTEYIAGVETIPFDTHAFVKELIAAGFTQQQAEAQVQVLARLVYDQLATKRDIVELQKEIVEIRRDIAELKAELKRDIKELESSTKRDLKELEMRLTIRLGAMLVVAVGVLAVLQKLL